MASVSLPPASHLIVSGATASDTVDLRSAGSATFITPSAFTGSVINFLGSIDGSTWYPQYDASNALIGVTVGPSRGYAVPASVVTNPFVRLTTPSAQAADRTIWVATKT